MVSVSGKSTVEKLQNSKKRLQEEQETKDLLMHPFWQEAFGLAGSPCARTKWTPATPWQLQSEGAALSTLAWDYSGVAKLSLASRMCEGWLAPGQ